jgi:hypothetical protein
MRDTLTNDGRAVQSWQTFATVIYAVIEIHDLDPRSTP